MPKTPGEMVHDFIYTTFPIENVDETPLILGLLVATALHASGITDDENNEGNFATALGHVIKYALRFNESYNNGEIKPMIEQ